MGATTTPDGPALGRRLLEWYDRHRRDLPWRAGPGASPDPYRVWLSEIMLQQTTVATVGPYFRAFLERWPTVEALAKADLDEVLHAWQGLGYYARARNLHACARVVAETLGGRFPDDETGLRALPGVGEYTAAAIAAIAFGRPSVPVDGNIARVMSRLNALQEPLPGVRQTAGERARTLMPAHRPGDFAQAMMDLGATVCTPRSPACAICPWMDACRARREERPETYPVAAAKRERPLRHGVIFWAERSDRAVLVRRRPEKGLLGGMTEFPSTDWGTHPPDARQAVGVAPCPADWLPLPGLVAHGFTHFRLELAVWWGQTGHGTAPAGHRWCAAGALDSLALPTLMRKVARHVEKARP